METKHRSHLIITGVCLMMVITSLWMMYDNFSFHTYGTMTYFDSLLSLDNDDLALTYYEVYKDEKQLRYGDATLSIHTPILDDGSLYTIAIVLDEQCVLQHQINYQETISDYTLQRQSRDDDITSFQDAKMQILLDDNVILEYDLKIQPVQKIYSASKEYRIDNASISDDYMRLGYLSSTNEEIIKEYPQVSLEYRYLKDEDGNEDDDNNYVVFEKISGNSEDIVNVNQNLTYKQDEDQESLLDKQLSVVVIFSNDQENFVFKMDFSKEVGDDFE